MLPQCFLYKVGTRTNARMHIVIQNYECFSEKKSKRCNVSGLTPCRNSTWWPGLWWGPLAQGRSVCSCDATAAPTRLWARFSWTACRRKWRGRSRRYSAKNTATCMAIRDLKKVLHRLITLWTKLLLVTWLIIINYATINIHNARIKISSRL